MSEYYKLKRLSKQAMPRTGRVLDAGGFVGGVRGGGSASGGGSGIIVPGHNELGGLVNSESYLRTDRYVHLTGGQLYELTHSVASRLSFVDGYLLYTADELGAEAVKVKAGFADEFPDIVETHKEFKGGAKVSDLEVLESLEIGEFIKSMSHGKGAGSDKHGNLQVESLEVRSYLMVLELIYNRLNALEGDYTFTDFGTIDAIEQVDATTYNLTIRKRWENDFTAFQEHDILYGIYNGGTSFFTSWMRVLTKDTMANIITVVLYADSEVPAQRNFAPCKGMNISRRGNAIAMEEHNKRQDSWQLSSYEGAITFMQSVAKPILEQSNYAMSIGKLPKLDIFKDLPINYDQPYIYARGAIIQDLYRLDYEGNIRKEITDRGLWSLETAKTKPYLCTEIEVHEVWHQSCKYQTIINQTQQEPRWNATDWLQVAGDPELSLELDSSNGLDFIASNVNTTITAFVYKGVNDITSDIQDVDWEWTRVTDDPVSDTTWGVLHANSTRSIDITLSDLGLNIHTTRQCKFTCKAYVRDNNNVRFEDISKSFEV